MRENARNEPNDFQVQLPLRELHSCGSCECLEPWLKGKQAQDRTPKTPIWRSWSIDALIALALFIWTWFAWVLIKRKGRSQILNLTPNHKSRESMGQMRSDWSLLYTDGNIFSRAIRYFCHILEKGLRYERPKFWDNKSLNFGTPTWESWEKVTFGCSLRKEAQSIL